MDLMLRASCCAPDSAAGSGQLVIDGINVCFVERQERVAIICCGGVERLSVGWESLFILEKRTLGLAEQELMMQRCRWSISQGGC